MKTRTLIFCMIFALCGCGAKGDADMARVQNSGAVATRHGDINRYKRQPPYANSNPVDTPEEFDNQSELTSRRSQAIVDNVLKIKGIENASVVINNNAAIIGVDLSEDFDDAALIRLKRDVESEARATDNNLERIAVTASKELVERISKIADDKTTDDQPVDPDSTAGRVIEQLRPAI